MKKIDIVVPDGVRTIDLSDQATVTDLINRAFGSGSAYTLSRYDKKLDGKPVSWDTIVTEANRQIEITLKDKPVHYGN